MATKRSALQTGLGESLGLKYPIFGFAHSVDVVCALAEVGCIGIFGATRDTPEEIEERLLEIRDRVGDKLFGVDLVLPRGMPDLDDRTAIEEQLPKEHQEFVEEIYKKYNVPKATQPGMRSRFVRSEQMAQAQIEKVLASDVNIFACGIGAPRETVARARANGKITIALLGNPRHVQPALDSGVDILVAQGHDAGAHTGPIGTFSLVPQIVDLAGDIPVLAAGGVATGRHIAASYALGAQGVWIGTSWLTTTEHALHPTLIKKLLSAGSSDTVISRADSGKTLRQIRTQWSDEWAKDEAPKPLAMPYQDILIGDLLGAIDEHEVAPLMHYPAGQSIAYSHKTKSVAEVVEDLVREGEATISCMHR